MIADRFGLPTAPTINELFHQLNPGRFASVVAREAGHILDGAVFVLIYLGFMIASREGFRGKVERLFPDRGHAEALEVAVRIQHGVQSYVWVQTVVGLIIAGASALVMWPMGISHLLFWAFLIFMANYIPAIGAAIGVLLPPLFGLVDLNDLWRPILLFVLLELIHFAVSHVVQPRMQGRSLNIDPIVVLLSLAFWGAIFGIAGAFLSTPAHGGGHGRLQRIPAHPLGGGPSFRRREAIRRRSGPAPPAAKVSGRGLTPFSAARFFTRSSTTAGSARVVVSPRLAISPSATLRRIRRMILPERVLGRPGAHWMTSGWAKGPISAPHPGDQLGAQRRRWDRGRPSG